MWLPKNERNLLAGYYQNVGKAAGEEVYEYEQLIRLLSDPKAMIRAYDEPDDGSTGRKAHSLQDMKGEAAEYIEGALRVEKANAALHERGLIEVTPHQHVWNVCVVKLTVKGYDLGWRYSRWFSRTGLRFAEYRNHWVWLIVSFLGGILGALVVHWLTASAGN